MTHTPEWERVFDAVTDTFWPEYFQGELNTEDLDKAAHVADLVTTAAPETDDRAGAPAANPPAGTATPTPAPSSPLPRLFELFRHTDVTGQSGTGVIAEGAQWTDGTASLRWRGKYPSTVAWDNVDRIVAVHGHQGATELVWLDEGPIDLWPAEEATTSDEADLPSYNHAASRALTDLLTPKPTSGEPVHTSACNTHYGQPCDCGAEPDADHETSRPDGES